MMISRILIILFLFVIQINVLLAEELDAVSLRYEQWELSRHGEKIVKIPELANLVGKMSEMAGDYIELHYPGGEEGELWVREFIDWLVALGVSSANVHAVPGSGNEDIIKIILIQGKQTNE